MKIKILIISLRRSLERRNIISARLNALCIEFEFVDAIDAQDLITTNIQQIQTAQRARHNYGRLIGTTEIACAMSHAEAYKNILASDTLGAIILEDDAIIDGRFKPFAEWLRNTTTAPSGLWLLGGGEYLEKQVEKNYFDFAICSRKPSASSPTWGSLFRIESCFGHLARACGYFIDRPSAQTLLAQNQPPIALADDWPFFIDQGWIEPYLCRPYLISHPLIIDNQSLLQADRSSPDCTSSSPKLVSRVKQKLGYYRVLYKLKLALHHFKHR